MKRILSIIIAAVMICMLCACNGNNNIDTTAVYEPPVVSAEKADPEIIDLIENLFSDCGVSCEYNVTYIGEIDTYAIYADVPMVTTIVEKANNGDSNCKRRWNEFVETNINLCSSLAKYIEGNFYEVHVCLVTVDSEFSDDLLLVVDNGEVIANAVG